MATPEAYMPIQGVTAKFNPVTQLEDECIKFPNSPLTDDLSPFSFQVVAEGDDIKSCDKSNPYFQKISLYHGRSYELKDKILWADEFGNKFLSVSRKGVNHSNPQIMRSATAPSGVIPMGLMEGDALLRITRASQKLRSLGIATEAILQIHKPETLYYKGEHLHPEEYKKRILLQVWDENNEKDKGVTREELPEIAAAFKGMEFYSITRATQVGERISDLDVTHSKERYLEHLGKIFESINYLQKASGNKNWEDLTVENKESIKKYYTEILPDMISTNYAKLHDAGIVHVFAHPGNVTGAGEICDLDSVKGKIGGKERRASKAQIKKDINYLLFECGNAIARINYRFHPVGENPEILANDVATTFQREIVAGYMEKRTTGEPLETLGFFDPALIEEMDRATYSKRVLDVIGKSVGYDFVLDKPEELLRIALHQTADKEEESDFMPGYKLVSLVDLTGPLKKLLLTQFLISTLENHISIPFVNDRDRTYTNLVELIEGYWMEQVFNLIPQEDQECGTIPVPINPQKIY